MKNYKSYLLFIIFIIMLLSSCKAIEDTYFISKNSLNHTNEYKSLIKKLYDPNIMTYQNKDDTYDMYLFSSPIYVSNDGKTYNRIDNSICDVEDEKYKEYKYTNKSNDIRTYIPSKLSSSNNILITDSTYGMEIIPQYDEIADVKKINYKNIYNITNESFIYNNMFGCEKYIVNINDFGINTELIVKNNINQFKYHININEVYPVVECSSYILFKDKNFDTNVAIIYAPVIINETEKLIEEIGKDKCTMDIISIGNETYEIIITLNEKCLKESPYPIKINQSFHLYKEKQADSAVYSKNATNNYLNNKVILGNDDKNGEGQLLVRFEELYFLNIDYLDVISAEYIISEISCEQETKKTTITLYPVEEDWCSITVNWDRRPAYYGQYPIKVEVDKSGDYSFDITNLLKEWLKNRDKEAGFLTRKGFILINDDPEIPKLFATGDNGIFTTCIKIKMKSL